MITNQILSSKLCTQVKYTLFWNTFKKETEKRIYNFLWNYKKKWDLRAHDSAFHFEGWASYFRHIHSIKNSLKAKRIQRNSTNAFWENLMLYFLNLILNSNQGLVLFRQAQIFRSIKLKNRQNKTKQSGFVYTVV